MDAPALRLVFDATYVLAMSAWLGSVLFVSFGVAPILFRVLDAMAASRFVRALFPRYYAWGATCGAIALPALLGAPLSYPEYRGAGVGVQAGVVLLCTGVMLYAGNILTPAINTARDSGPEHQESFHRLHRRSVRLDALVMLGLAGLLVVFVSRPVPRTSGIIEQSPQARAKQEYEATRGSEAAFRDSHWTEPETTRPVTSRSRP